MRPSRAVLLCACACPSTTARVQTSPFTTEKTMAENSFNKEAARTLRTTGKSVVASQDKTHARNGTFTKSLNKAP